VDINQERLQRAAEDIAAVFNDTKHVSMDIATRIARFHGVDDVEAFKLAREIQSSSNKVETKEKKVDKPIFLSEEEMQAEEEKAMNDAREASRRRIGLICEMHLKLRIAEASGKGTDEEKQDYVSRIKRMCEQILPRSMRSEIPKDIIDTLIKYNALDPKTFEGLASDVKTRKLYIHDNERDK
jgi:hypothetical protein